MHVTDGRYYVSWNKSIYHVNFYRKQLCGKSPVLLLAVLQEGRNQEVPAVQGGILLFQGIVSYRFCYEGLYIVFCGFSDTL